MPAADPVFDEIAAAMFNGPPPVNPDRLEALEARQAHVEAVLAQLVLVTTGLAEEAARLAAEVGRVARLVEQVRAGGIRSIMTGRRG